MTRSSPSSMSMTRFWMRLTRSIRMTRLSSMPSCLWKAWRIKLESGQESQGLGQLFTQLEKTWVPTTKATPLRKPTNAALMEMFEGLQAQVAALAAANQVEQVPGFATPAVEQQNGLTLQTPKMPSLGDALFEVQLIKERLRLRNWQLWWVLLPRRGHLWSWGLLFKLRRWYGRRRTKSP